MDEQHLIGIRIAIQLLLGMLGTTTSKRDVLVGQQNNSTGDWIARSRKGSCLDMTMPKDRLIDELVFQVPGRFQPDHPSGRPEMIDQTIGP
jgi:hypothetical protein